MTFTNLLSRAHKYCNVNELTNAKKQVDPDPQKSRDKRKRKEESGDTRAKHEKGKGPRVLENRFSKYTPLNVLREQLLTQI